MSCFSQFESYLCINKESKPLELQRIKTFLHQKYVQSVHRKYEFQFENDSLIH